MRRLLTIAWIASIGFFAIVLPIPYSTASLAWMISLYVLASASIILALLHSPPRMLRAVLEARALQWVGKRAYGLYLWQVPVIALPLPIIGRALPNPTWPAAIPQTVMRVALTFLIAAASYRWIELPFLRLKDRWSRLPRNEGVTPAAEIASVSATAASV